MASSFYFKGLRWGIEFISNPPWRPSSTRPSAKWPFHMGVLSVLQVLQGDPALIDEWLAKGRGLPEDRFYQALEELAPSLVLESYGRIHSKYIQGAVADILPAIIEVLFEMAIALCLLNQRWCTHDYYAGLVDTFAFPRLPEGYADLVPKLYRARHPEEILSLADMLVNSYRRFLAQEGIKVPDYLRVLDIPV